MSGRRPGISRSHGALGWTRRHLDVSAGPASVATCPLPPAPIARIEHPVIQAPAHKCYRVIRLYLMGDIQGIEDIGAFREPAPALQLIAREEGRARVLDPNGKVYADNWQKLERR